MNKPPNVEQVGPQARIQAELLRLESQKREFWVLIIFAGLVLILGFLTFFFPHRFWYDGGLHVSLSPQVLFVIMVATVLASLFYVRRDIEVRGLRLVNLYQYMTSQEEQANSMIDAVTNVSPAASCATFWRAKISRAERTNRPLALIMCDLNNFKQVNDRYGHLMGDYVLSQLPPF